VTREAGLRQSAVGRFLALAVVSILLGAPTGASELAGAIADPVVVGPERYSEDVSAFYLGLSGGYGSGGSDRFGLGAPAGTFSIGDLDLNGGYGGVRGGWRGVLPARGGRDYVYGFEIGYDFVSMDDTVTRNISGTTVRGSSEISGIASVRFKNGLTNPSGSVLYFVTFGLVQGDIKTTSNITSGAVSQSFENDDRRNGFSASIGAEHNLSEHWSISGELEYVQFQSEVIDFGSGFSTKSTPSYRGLRFGLNYKF